MRFVVFPEVTVSVKNTLTMAVKYQIGTVVAAAQDRVIQIDSGHFSCHPNYCHNRMGCREKKGKKSLN